VYRFFVPRDFGETMFIDGQDAHHITHVLRMKLGQQLQIVSLDQVAAVMEITGFGENRVDLALVETLEKSHEPSVKVTLIQGLPKQDKLEWVIQKAIELGVTEIRPAIMDHSVVKVDPARAAKKQQRWQRNRGSGGQTEQAGHHPPGGPAGPLQGYRQHLYGRTEDRGL
jgi:16S rRNA (uracil1498-N3)-methyltransferase